MTDFEEHLKRLQFMYSGTIIPLRTKVVKDRLNNPNCGPNKLILEVSATEGTARTILIKLLMDNGLDPKKTFKKVDKLKVRDVFGQIYKLKGLKIDNLLKTKVWKTFNWAIKYRNFLIHHCAFVGGKTSTELIKATIQIRKKLEKWL